MPLIRLILLLLLLLLQVFCLRPRLELALSGEEINLPAPDIRQDTYTPELGRGVRFCRFFRNMLADGSCPVAVSQAAGAFFMEEDFEIALLKEGQCPFSRQAAANVGDHGPL